MFGSSEENDYLCTRKTNMVPVVQLVRASDCGSRLDHWLKGTKKKLSKAL